MRAMNLRFLPKILLTLTALGVMTGGLASCNRIKAKLERLAAANQPPKAEPVPTALTAEEERINRALENPELLTVTPEQEAPKAQAFELNRSSIVSVLGYHDFRERGGTPMMIAADKFRLQMQAIRDSKIPVISMQDLLAWKRGEKNMHGRCDERCGRIRRLALACATVSPADSTLSAPPRRSPRPS